MSCKCQECGQQYTVDLLVADDTWERIKPTGKPPGGGLLCPGCIIDRLLVDAPGYGAWHLSISTPKEQG